ncbi:MULTISPECIES: hypothetical protein [unclassified Herbaspirillum]|uniref:hypothetical protein n=1 Tax=unclassified Herbaspirillum TaxID=2624150 RepID=UPI00114E1B37|nr:MULTISPECIES: hypothetical protein [unclassified Herbaspirillum]MBB5391675.1 hypothetical protein [Herbaspirillum sp. SJZ102]TQK03078.1 hypothetical protein FB599_3748 [Herbaspirillum sp. SJZ130]TQK06534.1 hypothetical protein FB598_3537 [Herbaspirillum sp. SJZ106]TWC62406.1 hypothetical protein FB597_11454 [Herbaspirillum sp. SJZ099]
MKRTLLGFCLLAGISAAASQAGAHRLDAPLADAASRWSSSVMERHAPMDSTQLQKLGQKKFRYMDMAQGKRSKSIRNAVIVRDLAGARQECTAQPQTGQHNSHFPSHSPYPVASMRPMT